MHPGRLLTNDFEQGPARLIEWASYYPQGVFTAERIEDVPTAIFVLPGCVVVMLGVRLERDDGTTFHLARVGSHVGWLKSPQLSFM